MHRPSRERGIVFCGTKPVRSGIVSRGSWGTLTKSQIGTLKYGAATKAKPNKQQTKRTKVNSGVISLADRRVTGWPLDGSAVANHSVKLS